MFNIQENFKEQVLVEYTIGDKRYNGLVGSSRSPTNGSTKWLSKMVSQDGSARTSTTKTVEKANAKANANPTYE